MLPAIRQMYPFKHEQCKGNFLSSNSQYPKEQKLDSTSAGFARLSFW